MRVPKPEWVASLRALTGQERDDIRFNTVLGRWEFVLTEADGRQRSQFWGVFRDPRTGQKLAPDPHSGLWAFRELDDAGMVEALRNLEMTFVGNAWDGAGTVRAQALRRMRANRALRKARYRDAANGFTDMAAERAKRLRGALQLAVPGTVATTLTPKE